MSKEQRMAELLSTFEHRMLTWQVGSHMYGMATPLSDMDYTHLVLDVPDLYQPFRVYPEVLHDEGRGSSVERKFYSLRKFAKMLVKGNPNTVELCWYESIEVGNASPEQEALRMFLEDVKPYVLTQTSLRQYLGHIIGVITEINKYNNPVVGTSKPSKPTSKRIAHALRIGYTAMGILDTGDMYRLVDNPEHLDRVMKYKQNYWGCDDFGFTAIKHMSHELGVKFDRVKDRFPEDSDRLKYEINLSLTRILKKYFN